jgi:hypothetical protein
MMAQVDHLNEVSSTYVAGVAVANDVRLIGLAPVNPRGFDTVPLNACARCAP